MSKAKVSLANGTVVEKPVVTCFKGGNATYLVMDNEANGQMGYPIICISRLNNNAVEKITDQNEWAGVKENLKTIIGGTALPYVAVPELLTGQDDFFTQLTLPVASFDVLKNAYAPAPETAPAATPVEAPVTAPVAPAPAMPAAPSVAAPEPSTVSQAPVATTIGTVPAADPVMTAPVITPLPAAPAMPDVTVVPLPVTTPAQTPMPEPVVETPKPVTPVVEPAAPVAPANDIQAIKDSFMKSCENMFDALIKKFENK